ncbi:putative bifunctional diguanylate cyclase/phosphodiesterase [Paenibacillus nasutitermitis]|uniref:Diguanylate cyclase n=1 Tax=Paenibacillus nasutitermitis TaxID=1652958 RepID=A0A916ZBB3_9BACL|nr:EAL domain-containing protein [Paenibacillus nasutitermitis]GGD84643.1 diguanylate cyclase [Paenibacillus nasutitermitis]
MTPIFELNGLYLSLALLAGLAGSAIISYGPAMFASLWGSLLDKRKQRMLLAVAGAACFSVSHCLVPLSVGFPVASDYYGYHLFFTLAGCYVATYFGLWFSSLPWYNTLQFLKTSFIVAFTILIFDYANTLFLFREHLVWKPELVLLTIATVLCICFSVLRILTQLKRNMEQNLNSWLSFPGMFLSGAALFGIPVLCTFSVLPIEPPGAMSYVYLIPYIVMLFISAGLYAIPDYFSEHRQMRQTKKMIETEQHYMSLYKHNPDGVLAFDETGVITSMNHEAEQMAAQLGYELIGTRFSDLLQGEQQQQALAHFAQVLEGNSDSIELDLSCVDGSVMTVLLTSLPIVVERKLVGAYSIAKNISKAKQDQATIRHLAYHDELTGLPNRRAFKDSLEHLTAPSSGLTPYFSMLFIDLDRFKRINDLFGHAFGDRVISQAAHKLKQCLPDTCTIARMGGDEFTVLIPHERDAEEIQLLAAAVVSEFSSPFQVGKQTVKLSASVGIARFPDDGPDADTLMRHADSAMYTAKENGSSQYQFYDSVRDQSSLEQMILEDDLEAAVDNDQLRLVYQPKIDIRTGDVIGFEALVRWHHPILGVVQPLKFIPLAEKTGIIVPIEHWVLRNACLQVKKWQEEGIPAVPVAVNISQIHLMQPDIFENIISLITELELDASLLELEITESAMMHKEDHVIEILEKLKQAGISVSMDDFGTGYSSLSYLQSLPICCLKIDRSFIRKITTDTDSRAIAEMIISMARQLGLTIVAEGVETKEQVALLRELQCYNVQGFYYSKPVSAEEAILDRGVWTA